MYGITSIICMMSTKGVQVQNREAIDETIGVIKMIFTPINSMLGLASLGNVFGKAKDQIIDTDKAGKRLIIIIIAFIIVLVFEKGYISDFIHGVLG